MHKTFESAIKSYLKEDTEVLEEISLKSISNNIKRDRRSRTRQDRRSQRQALDDSMDNADEISVNDFKPEGLGIDVDQAKADINDGMFNEVESQIEEIETMESRLDDHLRWLASRDTAGPLEGASDQSARAFENARNQLAQMKTKLVSISARRPSLEKKTQELNDFSASSS